MRKIKPPEEVKVNDGVTLEDKDGTKIEINKSPFLGTKPIRLTRSHSIVPINLFLPPGISHFYVERLNKHEIRFLIRVEEVERLEAKAEKMAAAIKQANTN